MIYYLNQITIFLPSVGCCDTQIKGQQDENLKVLKFEIMSSEHVCL